MAYKPKYCCQCSEKIDRIDWQPWKSRRFCELCETEFGIYDKMRWAVVGFSLVFGLFGVGIYFQKPEKNLNVTANQFAASNVSGEAKSSKNAAQISENSRVQTAVQPGNYNLPIKTQSAQAAPNLKIKQPPQSVEPLEKVYFCGAPTKKGTMCSRRVKNGGRCWQHEGQAALLPQEKLTAGRN